MNKLPLWEVEKMKICPVCKKDFGRPQWAYRYTSQWAKQVYCSNLCAVKSPRRIEQVKAKLRGRMNSPETRAKKGVANRRSLSKLDVRTKLSERAKLRYIDPAERKQASERTRRYLDDPQNLARVRELLSRTRRTARLARPSSIELSIRQVLDKLEIPYLAEHRIGRYLADIFIPEKNLVIECDGSYWHGIKGRAAGDARRDGYMVARGYTVLRLPEKAIKEGRAEAMLLRVIGQ